MCRPTPCLLLSPIFLIGAESPVSGQWVKGRGAIACDAVGALDAVAATGTLAVEENGSAFSASASAVDSRSDLWMLARCPARRRVGPPGPQPGAGATGRGGAALIQYGSIRQCRRMRKQGRSDPCLQIRFAEGQPARPQGRWRFALPWETASGRNFPAVLARVWPAAGRQHLIRRLCRAHPLPANSAANLPKRYSPMRSRRER